VAVIRKHRLPASWRHLVPGLFVLALAGLPLAGAATALLGWSLAAVTVLILWTLTAGIYGIAALVSAASQIPLAGAAVAPVLPLVYFVYHASYGSGFLTGLLWFASGRKPQSPKARVFLQMSR
jgi:hypothetical protein